MRKLLLVSLCSFFGINAYANVKKDISEGVTSAQASNLVSSLVKDLAPSGTKVNNISVTGSFELNDDGALAAITVPAVNFSVAYLFFKSNAQILLHTVFENGDCTQPKVLQIENRGTNSIIDNAIRDYINGNKEHVVRNYLIGKSDLLNACAVKPVFQFNFEDMDADAVNQYPVYFY